MLSRHERDCFDICNTKPIRLENDIPIAYIQGEGRSKQKNSLVSLQSLFVVIYESQPPLHTNQNGWYVLFFGSFLVQIVWDNVARIGIFMNHSTKGFEKDGCFIDNTNFLYKFLYSKSHNGNHGQTSILDFL